MGINSTIRAGTPFLVLFLLFTISYAETSFNFVTIGQGDYRYCMQGGPCNISNATFITTANINATGIINAPGFKINNTFIQDLFIDNLEFLNNNNSLLAFILANNNSLKTYIYLNHSKEGYIKNNTDAGYTLIGNIVNASELKFGTTQAKWYYDGTYWQLVTEAGSNIFKSSNSDWVIGTPAISQARIRGDEIQLGITTNTITLEFGATHPEYISNTGTHDFTDDNIITTGTLGAGTTTLTGNLYMGYNSITQVTDIALKNSADIGDFQYSISQSGTSFTIRDDSSGSNIIKLTSSIFPFIEIGDVSLDHISMYSNVRFQEDNQKLYFGAGIDSSIYYDGINMVINPKDVGSGYLRLLGDLNTTGSINASGKICDSVGCIGDGGAGGSFTNNSDVVLRNTILNGTMVFPSIVEYKYGIARGRDVVKVFFKEGTLVQVNSTPDGWGGTEYTPGAYSKISSSDNIRTELSDGFNENTDYFGVMTIYTLDSTKNKNEFHTINITLEGYITGFPSLEVASILQVWNYDTSEYEKIAVNDSTPLTDNIYTIVLDNPSAYLNDTNALSFLYMPMKAKTGDQYASIDEIYIKVSSDSKWKNGTIDNLWATNLGTSGSLTAQNYYFVDDTGYVGTSETPAYYMYSANLRASDSIQIGTETSTPWGIVNIQDVWGTNNYVYADIDYSLDNSNTFMNINLHPYDTNGYAYDHIGLNIDLEVPDTDNNMGEWGYVNNYIAQYLHPYFQLMDSPGTYTDTNNVYGQIIDVDLSSEDVQPGTWTIVGSYILDPRDNFGTGSFTTADVYSLYSGGDVLVEEDVYIEGKLAVGTNTIAGLSDGDINASTIYYDTLTPKSPIVFELGDDMILTKVKGGEWRECNPTIKGNCPIESENKMKALYAKRDLNRQKEECEIQPFYEFNMTTRLCRLDEKRQCEIVEFRYWKDNKCETNPYLECNTRYNKNMTWSESLLKCVPDPIKICNQQSDMVWSTNRCVYSQEKVDAKIKTECLKDRSKIWNGTECIDAKISLWSD